MFLAVRLLRALRGCEHIEPSRLVGRRSSSSGLPSQSREANGGLRFVRQPGPAGTDVARRYSPGTYLIQNKILEVVRQLVGKAAPLSAAVVMCMRSSFDSVRTWACLQCRGLTRFDARESGQRVRDEADRRTCGHANLANPLPG